MKDIFDDLKNSYNEISLSDDFNENVFNRINKKKKENKIKISLFVILIVIIGSMIFININSNVNEKPIIAKEELKKIEVPVLDQVYFSTHDEKNNYMIEFVSLEEENDNGI